MHGGESGDPLGIECIGFAAAQLGLKKRGDARGINGTDVVSSIMQGAGDRFAIAADGFQAHSAALRCGRDESRLHGHDSGGGVAEFLGLEFAAIEQPVRRGAKLH
jgi:hypothetical protein